MVGSNTVETDYFKQSNRCPNCGHRKNAHGFEGCKVVMGFGNDPVNDKSCKCKGKWVKQE